LNQDFDDYEIVICEDNSPERLQIRKAVNEYKVKYGSIIQYHENEKNLGYDGNIRELINKASGDFCIFMGNDDLMHQGALSKIGEKLSGRDNIGVLLRSYASFNDDPKKIDQIYRYFDKDMLFPPGEKTVVTFYRRSVVISGMTINRKLAVRYNTAKFDGTLLYQQFLVANILLESYGVYLSEVVALYRNNGIPDFGNNVNEKGKYKPKEQTVESSVHFMKGMLAIAKSVQEERHVQIFDPIVKDIGNYSYPILAIQSKRDIFVFTSYFIKLWKLGLGKSVFFYIYYAMILLLGTVNVDRLIRLVKNTLKSTPKIGKVYTVK
jgi:glycosyltransferase involved in cell wall biosynthesis